MSQTAAESAQGPAWWARFTLIGGIIAALLLVLGPIGYRLGILEVATAVLLLPGMATALAAITFLFALVGGFLTLRRGLVAERPPVLIGGVLALAILLNMWVQFSRAQAVPAIHDITTAPENPPEFVAITDIRGPGAGPLAYDAETLGPATREAYPEVRPIETDLAPERAFARAREVGAELGWEIVAAEPAEGRIEARDRTAMYGFEDVIAIRVRPRGTGSRIDLRSVSRVGESDLGTNAARIRTFITRFETR